MKTLQADLLAGVEPRTDLTIAKKLGGDTYHNLFGLGGDKISMCAHNETKETTKLHYGRTCMLAFGAFSRHIKKQASTQTSAKTEEI